VEVEVRTFVTVTESLEKVKRAVFNVFTPDTVKLEEIDDTRAELICYGRGPECLKKLYSALRRQRILDAARNYIYRGVAGDTIVFYLNKQAAYVGVVSFCSFPDRESPKGAITFIVKSSDVKGFINWLAPRTFKGKPIKEYPPPDP